MNEALAAVSSVVRFGPDFLTDAELGRLFKLSRSSARAGELRTLFRRRCFQNGFAYETVLSEPCTIDLPVNWTRLYSLNLKSTPRSDLCCCFVLFGGVLLSIPISGVPLEEVITSVNLDLQTILEKSFVIHHMLADGSVGPECFPGQSGSRFVAVLDESTVQSPRKNRSTRSTSRRRSCSFQYPKLPPLPLSAELGSSGGVRGRMILRESSDVHGWYKHVLFRSHSVNAIRQSRYQSQKTNHQVMSLYLASSPADSTMYSIGSGHQPPAAPTVPADNNGSRWILPPTRPTPLPRETCSSASPVSTLFPIHSPCSFDFTSLALAKLPTSPNQSSDQVATSYPPSRDLTPTLMSMIQELINRHIISEGTGGSTGNGALVVSSASEMGSETVLSRAIRHMATQFDSLSSFPPTNSSTITRDELKRKYSPLNGYNVARSVALNEIAKHVQDASVVEEIMRLAEAQGVRDRPLLAQLQRGQWSRLAPKKFRVAAYMLGPPSTVSQPPLPEESRGESARNRVVCEFSEKFFIGKFSWRIRVKFVPITNPIVDTGGFVVASWRSILIHSDEDIVVTVPRSTTGDQVFKQVLKKLEFKKNFKIEKDVKFSGSLCDDLRWCSSDFIQVSLEKDEDGLKIFFARNRIDVIANDESAIVSNRNQRAGSDGPMLWDVVDAWNSQSTRNRISQWNSGNRSVEESVTHSPINRRRRLMERMSTGGVDSSRMVRDEIEELGIDTSTEYTRWWLQSSEDEGTSQARSASIVRRQDEVKKDLQLTTLEVSVESLQKVDDSLEKRPTTPTSPITRSHRFSSRNSETRSEPRILRSSKDTRQFEFHPYDPNLVLAGSRSGVVSLIDSERDFIVSSSRIDASPILGIAWMRSHMNMALYGASSSGLVGYMKVGAEGIVHQPVGRFMNLSSVSINCTDDYFVVSGFSRDVSLFDAYTGRKMSDLKDIHSNFINIIRFSHYSPNLFATSSFDCSCKLWDLRTTKQIGSVPQPVSVYTTPTLNVMCCFSPLDESLLVSGLDGHVVQLSTRKGLVPNLPMEQLSKSIPSRNSTTNYRRSVYLANGDSFITSGTDENFMRVIDAKTAQSRGICRFDNLLDTFENRISQLPAKATTESENMDASSWMNYEASVPTNQLTGRASNEYVQSLRGHPIFPNEVGVLLYPFDRSRASYICMTRIPSSN